MTNRISLVVAGYLVLLSLAAVAGSAESETYVHAAFAALDRGDAESDGGGKRAAYNEAQAAAEEAVRLDDANGHAHYALFCSFGRLTELRGSIAQALMLPRLRRELNRALQLDPAHSDALAAKAEMLFRLPRFLGGNVTEAETFARRALQYDPTYWRAHILLARILIAQSRHSAARAELTAVLERIDPQRNERAEASALLTQLGDESAPTEPVGG